LKPKRTAEQQKIIHSDDIVHPELTVEIAIRMLQEILGFAMCREKFVFLLWAQQSKQWVPSSRCLQQVDQYFFRRLYAEMNCERIFSGQGRSNPVMQDVSNPIFLADDATRFLADLVIGHLIRHNAVSNVDSNVEQDQAIAKTLAFSNEIGGHPFRQLPVHGHPLTSSKGTGQYFTS
jgi:hypothetical protein